PGSLARLILAPDLLVDQRVSPEEHVRLGSDRIGPGGQRLEGHVRTLSERPERIVGLGWRDPERVRTAGLLHRAELRPRPGAPEFPVLSRAVGLPPQHRI